MGLGFGFTVGLVVDVDVLEAEGFTVVFAVDLTVGFIDGFVVTLDVAFAVAFAVAFTVAFTVVFTVGVGEGFFVAASAELPDTAIASARKSESFLNRAPT